MQTPDTTILIADDSALLRDNIRKLLTGVTGSAGIRESDTVTSTIQAVGDVSPDVLILDLQFPDGSGFDVLDYLRSHEIEPLVIVLTNFPSAANKKRALSLGATHFLDKSYEYEQIIAVLEAYITQSGRIGNPG